MNYFKKGLLTAGIASATLVSTTVLLNQTSVDAASATANSGYGQVELWNNINGGKTRDSNTLSSGSSWNVGNRITASDGESYYKVGNNEYANANQMDGSTENSKQKLTGDVKSGSGNGSYVTLYTNPLNGAHVVKNRGLMKHTEWYTDQRVIVNGQVYYRVATNEWTKGSDSQLISEKYRGDKVFLSGNYSNNTDNNSNNDQKPYLDVPYSTEYQYNVYSLLLKSNGEYVYNYSRPTNHTVNPGIKYEKGTYTVDSSGLIHFNATSSLYADWGDSSYILKTKPQICYFSGEGSNVPAEKSKLGLAGYTVADNGTEIKTDQGTIMTLTAQPGLTMTDPEKIGPGLYKQYWGYLN
ncbi:SLAP domain-containing protein [Companilactobacillus jidongensis]|uniref:SLAP domain-containing protein n=1 Tax=Companilactobacillus jidongensis TaxID=2486006 RepID=UPI000F7A98FD|nr:SLAP domain-containing protein [Companilactobacillus jidongensis]